MTTLAIKIAFGLSLLTRLVHSSPAYQLMLKIDKPQPSLVNPTTSSNPIYVLNVAGIQIYGSGCPSTGCIHQSSPAFGGLPPYSHKLAYSYYVAGNGAVNLSMSSFMPYASDVLDNSGPNMDRNASYCIDNSDITYCATDYTGESRIIDMSQNFETAYNRFRGAIPPKISQHFP